MLSTLAFASTAPTPGSDVSVVIPVYNEGMVMGRCIESVMRQNYPSDRYEVIIVDNNSTDNTKDIIDQFILKFPARIHYVLEMKQGAAFARNAGIGHSRGDIIAFTDGDCVVSDDWLMNVVSVFSDLSVGAVQGKIVVATKPVHYDEIITEALIHQMFAHVDYGTGTFRLGPGQDMVSANMAVRKDILLRHGVFNNAFVPCEDTELSRRFEKLGVPRYYCSYVLVEHYVSVNRMNEKSILRLCYRWGKVDVLLREHDNISNLRYLLYLVKWCVFNLFKLAVAMLRNDRKRVFISERALVTSFGRCNRLVSEVWRTGSCPQHPIGCRLNGQ